MKKKVAKKLAQSKRKIKNRLDKRFLPEVPRPMLNPGNIHYEIADHTRGITCGGIGAVQMMVKKLELDKAIYKSLRILKLRNHYFESDHFLNID
ncbi:MAG: IS1380 family transposase, partial [Candidatus Aminicenantes bacterium]|nr:IS1380 family transposase [Candidatus Aminicenantes bacterium]